MSAIVSAATVRRLWSRNIPTEQNVVNIRTRSNFNTSVDYYIYSRLLVRYMLTRYTLLSDRLILSGMRTSTASEEWARYVILLNNIILIRLTLVFGVSFWVNRNKRTAHVYATLVKRYGSPRLHFPTGWKKREYCLRRFRRRASHATFKLCASSRSLLFFLQTIYAAPSIPFTILWHYTNHHFPTSITSYVYYSTTTRSKSEEIVQEASCHVPIIRRWGWTLQHRSAEIRDNEFHINP